MKVFLVLSDSQTEDLTESLGKSPHTRGVTKGLAIFYAKKLDLTLQKVGKTAEGLEVVKIVDASKEKYLQKKKNPQKNKKPKEIKFSVNIFQNDLERKCREAESFLSKGLSVKVSCRFRGREMKHSERGELILLEMAKSLEKNAKLSAMPKLQGRVMSIFLTPKQNSKK